MEFVTSEASIFSDGGLRPGRTRWQRFWFRLGLRAFGYHGKDDPSVGAEYRMVRVRMWRFGGFTFEAKWHWIPKKYRMNSEEAA